MNSIVLLCSGALGAIVLKEIHNNESISFVFTDKQSSQIIEYCKTHDLPFHAGNPRNADAKEKIKLLTCEVLLSVNYLFIVDEDLLSIGKYAINFHGSLLPRYRGRTPHVWAIINGEKKTGITAHLMNTEVDNGPVVKQFVVDIDESDTGHSILQKFNLIYPQLVSSVLADIKLKNLKAIEQDHSKATYFGKRTPTDGEINWNWQKERIKNWVRAQAQPYPGAFSFYENEKLTINRVEFSDLGFHCDDENGKILQVDPELIVKTPNGAIKLLEVVTENNIQFQTGKILSCQK